jgi:hypothetical protein
VAWHIFTKVWSSVYSRFWFRAYKTNK